MSESFDVVVVGAGPAGVFAALRAADLGARTALVTRDAFGGMAANDGPVPVRTLAHAARLVRDVRQVGDYGIAGCEPIVDYARLLARVKDVVTEVRQHSTLRNELDALGVTVREQCGVARFTDSHTLETVRGRTLRGDRIVLCTGGRNRSLRVPGAELTATHSDAWSLDSIPPSMIVVGAGATGVQVASIFRAFGTRVQLFEAGPRILANEDVDVSAAMSSAFRRAGIDVHEGFGAVESFAKTDAGVRMTYSKNGERRSAEAALAVVAIGWVADIEGLNLGSVGIETTPRGFVRVDPFLQTTASHVFAAGDVIGGAMLTPHATTGGFVAGTNAVVGRSMRTDDGVMPIGSFTDPEYAQVGLTEAAARAAHEVIVATTPFASTTRPIIDGRTTGFCKLIVERSTRQILGCHIVGERAVDLIQLVAVAMHGAMPIDSLARLPLSWPTYASVIARAAVTAMRTLQGEQRFTPAV